MAATSYSTPLSALDAVSLDLETTSLDARAARIVQIGAVRLRGLSIVADLSFDEIVDPGVAIPKATTAVHGIAAEDVAGRPQFPAMAPRLSAFCGNAIVIGHMVSYDLAVLAREHQIAGLSWRPPRALCLRILARLAAPTLAHYTLDRLCEWLEITIEGRHTAIGDARAAAELFIRLVPLLRARNIRTLAEAENASRELAEQEARVTSGFPGLPPATVEDTRALARIDSFPYRHRVRDVMTAPPLFAPPSTTVADAINLLLEKRSSSVFVRADDGRVGIVTERDILRAIGSGADGLAVPLGTIMQAPLQTVLDEAFVYRAIARMDRLGFRHLGVRDAWGDIVGAVTTRNLLRNRATTALVLGDEIGSASTPAELGRAWARVPMMARSLVAEDVDARVIAHVISSEIRIMTQRAFQMAEAELEAEGQGAAPVPFALLVLGSAGRGESLLAADQDNALVYSHGAEGGDVDRWFERAAGRMNDILDEAGIMLCKGGVMARNRAWRMSVDDWRRQVGLWIGRQRPQDLLNVDIFYDAVAVHGDTGLAEAVLSHAFEAGAGAPDFLAMLAEVAASPGHPFTLFGGLKLDDAGRIDLKKAGLMPIFTAARVLAIRHRQRVRATPERLMAVHASGVGAESDIAGLVDAHRVLLGAMLRQQLLDSEAGVPLSSRVMPAAVGSGTRNDITAALRAVPVAVDLVTEGRFR